MTENIRTFIKVFDDNYGGLLEGTSTLIYGPPGTMKSSLAYYILSSNYQRGKIKEKVLYYLTEQNLNSFENQIHSMDSLIELIKPENQKVIPWRTLYKDFSSITTIEIPEELDSSIPKVKTKFSDKIVSRNEYVYKFIEVIKKHVIKSDLKLIVIDTISSLYGLIDEGEYRYLIRYLLAELSEKNVTSIIISDDSKDVNSLSYLVDNIFHIPKSTQDSPNSLSIHIEKMRGKNITTEWFILYYDQKRKEFCFNKVAGNRNIEGLRKEIVQRE